MAFGLDLAVKETPQLQRQMQKTMALPKYHRALQRTAQKQVYGQAAAGQMRDAMRSLDFRMKREAGDKRLALAERNADLKERQLGLVKRGNEATNLARLQEFGMQRQRFQDQQDSEVLGTYLGLGTFGAGLMFNEMDRRRQDESDLAIKNYLTGIRGLPHIPAE